jgi:hypothetical protein
VFVGGGGKAYFAPLRFREGFTLLEEGEGDNGELVLPFFLLSCFCAEVVHHLVLRGELQVQLLRCWANCVP